MSYLNKLIDRATDVTLDLENNTIGNYKITPQHGMNILKYSIYKNKCLPRYSKSNYHYNVHVASISIDCDLRDVEIEVNETYLNHNEISDIIDTVHNIYSEFNIITKNF